MKRPRIKNSTFWRLYEPLGNDARDDLLRVIRQLQDDVDELREIVGVPSSITVAADLKSTKE